MLQTYEEATRLLNEIERLRNRLEKESSKSSLVWKKLNDSYHEDVKVSDAPELGKDIMRSRVAVFKSECKQKLANGELYSREFLTSVRDFLTECRSKLRKVFDGCKFRHVDICLAKLNEKTVEEVAFLKETARKLTGQEQSIHLSAESSEGLNSFDDVIGPSFSHGLLSSETFERQIEQFTSIYKPDVVAEDHESHLDTSEIESEKCITVEIHSVPGELQTDVEQAPSPLFSLEGETKTLEEQDLVSSILEESGHFDEHRELCEQVTFLRDLTSRGSVPIVSSSWWGNVQEVVKIVWGLFRRHVKEKVMTVYSTFVGPPGMSEVTSTAKGIEDDMCSVTSVTTNAADELQNSLVDTDGHDQYSPPSSPHDNCGEPRSTMNDDQVQDSHHSPSAVPSSGSEYGVLEEMDPARDDCQSYEGDKQSAVTDLAAETVTVTGVEDSGSEVSAVDTACELSGYFDSPASNSWSDELLLDYAIDSIQKLMEEECEQYFTDIAASAIKYFHGLYQLKIKTSLEMFDKDFKVQLESKAREIKKLKDTATSVSSEVSSLKKHEDALQKLCEQLVDVWKDLGFSLEDLIIKKAQQKEQVMRWAMTTRDELDSL